MLKKILDLLFPKGYSCIVCSEEIFDSPYGICKSCEKKLPYLKGNLCLHCSDYVLGAGYYCKRCKGKKFICDRAIAPFEYSGIAKKLILGLKYSNKKYYAEFIAKFIADCITENKLVFDYIVAVPLCEKRLKSRGYNQAFLLAQQISKILNKPLLENVLIRVKETPTQTVLNKQERLLNMKDAFKVKNKKLIKGKTILIVDDVYTTGATIDSCSKVLKDGGAMAVYCVTVGHTIKNTN